MTDDIKPGYTRVSEFCSRYEKFGSVSPEYLAYRADVGTQVHKAIRMFLSGMAYELCDEAKPFFESWISWYHLMKEPLITHEETRMYCDKWMLTGAIDGILHLQGMPPMIVDWKTSSSENKIMWPIKGAFYLYLARVNKLLDLADRAYYLKLDKHGGQATVCDYEITGHHRGMVTAIMMSYRLEEQTTNATNADKNWRRE
jgi:hypothetical protein